MRGFIKGNANHFIGQHRKIISDYEVKFLAGPISSLARFL